MQGSYKTSGLPRPYYMKPHSKRTSAYDKMPRQFFYTNSRKLTGYMVMLFVFGLCIFMVSQEMKAKPDPVYELEDPSEMTDKTGDVGKLVDSAKGEDRADEKAALASKENNIVVEAPKGGMVNEGPIVGNDEGLAIDGKPRNTKNTQKISANAAQAAQAAQAGQGAQAKVVGGKVSAKKITEEELQQKLLEVDHPNQPGGSGIV